MTGVIGKASATSSGASSHTSSHTSSKSHSYDHDHDHEHGYEYGKPVVVVSKPEWCGNRERVNHSDQMRVVCKYRKMDYSQHYEKRSVAFLTHLNSNLLIIIDVLSMNNWIFIHTFGIGEWKRSMHVEWEKSSLQWTPNESAVMQWGFVGISALI